MLSRLRFVALLACCASLAACYPVGRADRPLAVAMVRAPVQPARRLVVFLPGRGDDLDGLRKSGIAAVIQHAWPDTNVELVGLTMAYYTTGNATARLHDEVMLPAMQHGHVPIWLAGTSMGAMGSLMYTQAYPGQVHGMILLGPYLGEHAIRDEIRRAGGVTTWEAGAPQPIGPHTWQRELWRYLKSWSSDPALAQNVWLSYGDHDRYRGSTALMAPLLPHGHVFVVHGGHDWAAWTAGMREILAALPENPRDTP